MCRGRRDHRGRLGLGSRGGVPGIGVAGAGKGLLGHPESGSSWEKKLRALRALRPERKLGGCELFLEGRGQTLPGQLGAARRGRSGRRGRRARGAGRPQRGPRREAEPGRAAKLVGAPSGCRFPPAPGAAAGPARRRHGGEPHPGADGADGALRGPAAGWRRGAATAHRALRRSAQLPAQLHPERAVVHRPARPPGLHHGGGQRRQVLQQDGHGDRGADGRGQRGE